VQVLKPWIQHESKHFIIFKKLEKIYEMKKKVLKQWVIALPSWHQVILCLFVHVFIFYNINLLVILIFSWKATHIS
jgi:hypothetical protein